MRDTMIGSGRPLLADWKRYLSEVDFCPYVGPRPQTPGRDRGMLIGRAADLERINKAVVKSSLVVLDGNSGVGKSSLLQNGLYARLRKSGFGVLVSRKWTKDARDLDSAGAVDRYLAGCIRRTHEESGIEIPDPGLMSLDQVEAGAALCAVLDAAYRSTAAVLILDQFEELLRQNGAIAEKVVRWVITMGFRHRTRVVISLRADSVYRLDPLLRGVKPFSMDRVRLEEIQDEASIRAVITSRRPPDDAGESPGGADGQGTTRAPIAEEAVDGLMALWREHRPKLLDLQATLYALYFRAGASEIGPGDVDRLAADAWAYNPGRAEPDPFALGLRESIRLKIEHAEAASRKAGIDDYLLSGTLEIVRRLAPLLSSGDFKIPIHQFELARRALTRELRVLERALVEERTPLHAEGHASVRRAAAVSGEAVDALFAELLDTHDVLAARPGDIPLLAKLLGKIGSAGRALARRTTAGPMMQRTATATLLEEVRRVAFAIEWLESTEIIRKDPDGTLLLVHDRSGDAFTAWANAQDDEPAAALRQLTGARGEHYVWMEASQGVGNLDPESASFRVIANLNWRECRVSTRFRRVVFVNCDFSGSRFEQCTFEGVMFVNCLLDDANFEHCVVRGSNDQVRLERKLPAAEDGEGGKRRLAPSFTVEASKDEIGNFKPYLDEFESEPSQFFSDTSGVAAVPGTRPADHRGQLLAHFVTTASPAGAAVGDPDKVVPSTGGVTMVGGRLCFLTLYGCGSEHDGSFAFHHVSGGGLDIVEQYGGSIEVHDGAIRGISITRDNYGSVDLRASRGSPEVALTVHDSLVANVYFADDLTGSAAFQDSFVLMLINGSDNARFRVHIQNCRYQFLVNTDVPDGKEDSRELQPPEGLPYFDLIDGTHSRFRAPNRKSLAGDLEAMDYRLRPELFEESQRNGGPPAVSVLTHSPGASLHPQHAAEP